MKKIIPILFLALFCLSGICFAGSQEDLSKQQNSNEQLSTSSSDDIGVRKEYLAEQKVKMLPSIHGDTVDSYLTNMAKIPMAEDLGWKVYAIEDGYEVERSILVNKSKMFRYKWKVSNTGEVTPLDDEARKLTK
ncbi:MAG: hypothetical protein JSW69_01045 [Deltaproteobacteria bacterium]|nr:MAG: hypothetical protein JSW69_01045 [Deltaproteobacteria bacterium]